MMENHFNKIKNKYKIIPFVLGICLLIVSGCKKEDEATKPLVSTLQVTDITFTTATCGGNISSDGGDAVTARGVVWGTAENPTIDNCTGLTTDGEGTGNFTSLITELAPGNLFHVKAYATNAVGTVYGEEVTCKTDSTITDVDGNVYRVVKMGNQIWMAENLKTTKYNDGTAIPLVSDSTEWANLSTPGNCWYNNDSAAYAQTYGALYNWYTVNTGKLCPGGWHVPSDEEWKQLEMYLGMSQEDADASGNALRGTNEGSKLAGNAVLWEDGNLVNDPEFGTSGFQAFPGGGRTGTIFYQMNFSTVFWTAAADSDSYFVYIRAIHRSDSHVGRLWAGKSSGRSVRCVKDE
jgi:uncharacterized protein (TIGR02145 family)